jgi:RNA polymerase sigma-70 factor (ECF subfamily)
MERNVQPNADAGSNDEDLGLIGQFQGGARRAFDRLVLKYQDRIFRLCVRLTGSTDEGEDAAQETFIKVHHGLEAFKGEARFSTWLYQIALNTCRNRQRSWWNRLKRRAVRLDEPIEGEDGTMLREIGDLRHSPDAELQRKRIAASIKAGLEHLPLKHREMIVLRDIQGLSYEEIVTVAGISEGTVKSRLARARESLRDQIKGHIDE